MLDRFKLYRDGMARHGATLGQWCGFVAVSPLIVRMVDETQLKENAVATDPRLIECGLSQEPLSVYHDIPEKGADPFDRATSLYVLGRCAYEDATRWLSAFPWLAHDGNADALWCATNLDYSLGTKATGRVLNVVRECLGGHGDVLTFLDLWAKEENPKRAPYNRWWGKADPGLVCVRISRQVRRIRDAAQVGSLAIRQADPPPELLPANCRPMPDELNRICDRLAKLRKQLTITADDYEQAWREVRAYARTRKPSAPLPIGIKLAAWFQPREMRHPEAAADRRVA